MFLDGKLVNSVASSQSISAPGYALAIGGKNTSIVGGASAGGYLDDVYTIFLIWKDFIYEKYQIDNPFISKDEDFLDLVDENELEEALKEKVINHEQYELAYKKAQSMNQNTFVW